MTAPGSLPLDADALDAGTGWTTREPGTYLLLLQVAEQAARQVGRFGQVIIQPGWYVYVGSARGGLGARLRRHARTGKRRHWHIDALGEVARLARIPVRVGGGRLECAAAAHVAALPGAACPIARFGASDCRCPAQRFFFADEPRVQLDATWIVRPVARLPEPPRPC